MLRALVAFAVCGCGRIGFDAAGDARAGDAGRDGPSTFCATQTTATFCSDFDDGRGTGAWSATGTTLGTLTIDPALVHSAPNALRVDTANVPSGMTAGVGVEVDGLGTATGVTVSFWMYASTIGTSEPVLLHLIMDDGSALHELELVGRAGPSVIYLEDVNTPSGGGQSFQYYQSSAVLASGAWHHYVLGFTSGAGASVGLSIDGIQVLSMTPVYTTGGQLVARLGATYMSGVATPWQLYFDDVTIDVY